MKIRVITTGGTIAGQVANKDTEGEPLEAKHFTEQVQHTLTRIKEKWNTDVKIKTVSVANVDSSDILPKHWTKI